MKWEEILKSMFVDANKAYKELGFIYGSHGVGRELHHIVLKKTKKP